MAPTAAAGASSSKRTLASCGGRRFFVDGVDASSWLEATVVASSRLEATVVDSANSFAIGFSSSVIRRFVAGGR